ncbi:MAG: hypothetical protein LBM41_02875, partial [Ruminococcus sp.]|nr:hypothetical protein [Ruminococcus sp.]
RWAILIENADKKNFTAKAEEYMDREDFSMAMDMLSSFSRDETQRLHAMSREKFEKDYSFSMRKSKESGQIEARTETAKTAFSLGLPIDIIAKLTGFSESELKSIMSNN